MSIKQMNWLVFLVLASPLMGQPFQVPQVPPYFQELADRAKNDLNAVLELERELTKTSGRCLPKEWDDFRTSIQDKLKKMVEQDQIKDPELMYQLVEFRPLREGVMNEDWQKKAAEAGHPIAMLAYAGRVYRRYNPRLRAEGEALYRSAAPKVLEAALAGNRRVYLALTRGSSNRLKLNPPYDDFWFWYNKLLEKKDRLAYKAMAEIARYKVDANDYALSLAMAQEAANAGEWEAMVYLAECYKYGQGVPEDSVKAKYWLDKVVEVTGCDAVLDHLDDEGDDTLPEDGEIAVAPKGLEESVKPTKTKMPPGPSTAKTTKKYFNGLGKPQIGTPKKEEKRKGKPTTRPSHLGE